MSNQNFTELLVLTPNSQTSLSNPTVLRDLQWVLNTIGSGSGAIHSSFRLGPKNQLLFTGIWAIIQDHDDLDIRGVTPKLLKTMLSHLTTSSVYFLYTDASKIDFDAPMLGIDAYHVKSGQKDEFEKVVDGMGGGTPTGGWYVTKKIPPLPRVMPTDPEELRMVVGGRERAERRLKEKNPEIFVVIEGLKDGERELGNELDSKVERYVEKVERGVYGKFLEGKRDEGLEDR